MATSLEIAQQAELRPIAQVARGAGLMVLGGYVNLGNGDWAGTENLEERVDGIERIDPVVLEALRKKSA